MAKLAGRETEQMLEPFAIGEFLRSCWTIGSATPTPNHERDLRRPAPAQSGATSLLTAQRGALVFRGEVLFAG